MTTKTLSYVTCSCRKKPECYCKAWNGKGASGQQNLLPSNTCAENTNPDTCEFLVEPKKREGCDWVWQTISGSPKAKTETVVISSKAEAKEMKQTLKQTSAKEIPTKQSSLTCVQCGEEATHKIKGYRPTPVCILHAEEAKADGYELEEIKHA